MISNVYMCYQYDFSVACWLQFAEKVVSCLESKKQKKKFNLIIFTESAIGMISLPDICRRANEISEMGAPFVLEGIVFGSDDYLADIGKMKLILAVTIAVWKVFCA